MKKIVLILHNIRSTYNVGAIARTAECLEVSDIYATGYTAYTESENLVTMPHILNKMRSSIHKTALGAENKLPIKHHENINELIRTLREDNYRIAALEQSNSSIPLNKYKLSTDLALIVGEEVKGVTEELQEMSDEIIEIPMLGTKESFNVSVALGITLYELRRDILSIER
jgi:tRNA G18 (ribose-2'-O)-methylase SpoU